MRANEFVVENKLGKVSAQQQQPTVGLNVFSKKITSYDRIYDLNRLMMAVACSDGVNPIEMPAESWIGKHNSAHPYTEEEHIMLKQAFNTIPSNTHHMVSDHRSTEPVDTHKTSPVTGFKGYKRK